MLVNYYDAYDTWKTTPYEFTNIGASDTPYPSAKGLLTGTYRRFSENRKMLLDANYYDAKNRLLQQRITTQYTTGTVNFTNFQYSFSGDVLAKQRNYVTSPTIYPWYQYNYDHVGRKLQNTFQFLGSPQQPQFVMARHYYDEIGRQNKKIIQPNSTYDVNDTGADYINRPPALEQANTQDIANKAVIISPPFTIKASDNEVVSYLAKIDTPASSTSVNGLQTIDFEYNVRGQMNCINCRSQQVRLGNKQNDLFSMKLNFHEDSRYFDGNISKQIWKSSPPSPSGGVNARSYLYSYDKTSRLLKAKYAGGNSGENFSIDTMRYDRNGNILQLKRHQIDDLSYIYDGNKLLSVTDGASNTAGFNDGNTTGNDYGYWENGALKYDKNKGIDSIVYNSYLKKVSRVKFSNGNWINFFYDGLGTLLKRKLSNDDVWTFEGDLIFKNNQIYQLNHDDGRITRDNVNNAWVYEYDYRDHLGNLRVSFRDSSVTGKPPVVVQVHETDAFGLQIDAISYEKNGSNDFKFQNQLKIEDFGWNWNFFKYRIEDSEIGRFFHIDPLADHPNQVDKSPYAYGWNNPVNLTDPDGRCPDCPGENGEIGMMIGAAVMSVKNSILTLAYNAGDALGITPTAQGMKWEAVERRVGDRYETVMEQVPRQGFLKDAGGHLLDGINAVAAVSPASGTTTGLLAKTAPNAVVTTSAVKSAKESVGGVISGYTRHGSNQAIGRDAGRGVKATEMLDAVKNPNKVVNQSNGGIRYEGSGAKVVVNSDGKVISTFGKARGEAIYTHGKGNNALNRAKELGIEYDPKKIR